jgi:hypothetical protein
VKYLVCSNVDHYLVLDCLSSFFFAKAILLPVVNIDFSATNNAYMLWKPIWSIKHLPTICSNPSILQCNVDSMQFSL